MSPGRKGDNPNGQLSANSPFTLSHIAAPRVGHEQRTVSSPTVDYAFDHVLEASTPNQEGISGQIQPISQSGGPGTNPCRFQGFVVHSESPQP